MAEMSREDRLHKIEDGSTERISVEDAIEVLSHPCYYECFEVLNIAHDMAIEALEKADKYRWHDLRKNPEDLPKNEQEVEICAEQTVEIGGNKRTWKTYTHGIHEDGTVHTENSSWVWDEIDCYGQYCEETDDWIIPEGWWEQSHYTETNNWVIYDKVIAWRYIEPFESEVEEDGKG